MQNIIYVSKVVFAYLLGFYALAGIAGIIVNRIMKKYHFKCD